MARKYKSKLARRRAFLKKIREQNREVLDLIDSCKSTECGEKPEEMPNVVDLEELERLIEIEKARALRLKALKAQKWVKTTKGWHTKKRKIIKKGNTLFVKARFGPKAINLAEPKLHFRGPVPRIPKETPRGRMRGVRRSERNPDSRPYYLESVMNQNYRAAGRIPPWVDFEPHRGFLHTRWCPDGDAWARRWGENAKRIA